MYDFHIAENIIFTKFNTVQFVNDINNLQFIRELHITNSNDFFNFSH